jgi:hypothetical protein
LRRYNGIMISLVPSNQLLNDNFAQRDQTGEEERAARRS